MDLGDMFNQLQDDGPGDDWDRWDYIEHLFRIWLDNSNEYGNYRESNAMIHFLREYYTPITIMLNHIFKDK